MLPLTGTSSPEHMQQDLASLKIQLSPEQVAAIESLVA
jgi:aryl-alcohol dehydrogenase-like predicted oxidoreductase